MSDINLDFTVSNNSINFTVEPNEITITPTDIQLTFAPGVISIPGGSNTQLQYNNNGALGGIPNVTFNGSNISLGNVSTVKITGGTNGYVLQTDGTGNLDWTAMSGNGGGNGTPGGSNTQIQYNDSGAFGGNTGFTFNEITGVMTSPFLAGNANGLFNIVGANVSGEVAYATTANSVAGANVSGEVAYATTANAVAGANVSGAVNLATYATTANSVAGANVSGAVNLATYATTANAVAGANVSGEVANANYSSYANIAASANSVAVANVSGIGNIATINLDGSNSNVLYGNGIFSAIDTSLISNGNSRVSIDTASGPITIYANSTVTPVATFNSNGLTRFSQSVSTINYILYNPATGGGGTINFSDSKVQIQTGGLSGFGNFQIVIGANDPGNADFAIAIGNAAGTVGANAIAIGKGAYANLESVSIGALAGGGSGLPRRAVSIGQGAGFTGVAGSFLNHVAIGWNAGQQAEGPDTIAVGGSAGNSQEAGAIAIGGVAGNVQDTGAIAIGFNSGANQGLKSIAIGQSAGQNNQGNFSIAIGTSAGETNQHSNTTILNSNGTALNSTQANSLFVKPIRDVTGNVDFTVTLKYNPTTGEIGYV